MTGKDTDEISWCSFIIGYLQKWRAVFESRDSLYAIFRYVLVEHVSNEFPNRYCVTDICKVHKQTHPYSF